MTPANNKDWLDKSENVNKVVYAFYAVCGVALLCDLLYHKHTHFDFEHWFGFSGICGFVGCVGMVLMARLLRVMVMRPEDYYDG